MFWMDYTHRGGEYPKFWEPRTRMRYRLVADGQSVARFPAAYPIKASACFFTPAMVRRHEAANC